MSEAIAMFPRARIPYGTWGSSPFAAWQASRLAEVNIGQLAGESFARILGLRRVPSSEIEYLITASTVPWHWKFWNSPMVASCLGRRIPGFHIEQACATGLQAACLAAAEIEGGAKDVVGVVTFDRTSDSPAGVFPERRGYRRTEVISDVWDNFGFDPATGKSMIAAAGNVARKYKLDRAEVDAIAHCRHEQYFDAEARSFLKKFLVPVDLLDVRGKPTATIDADIGVARPTIAALRGMRELDTCVTSGTQTHAADGMAALLVATRERSRELSLRPEIDIRFVAKEEVRVQPSFMPEAPTVAVGKLLDRTGLALSDIAVLKTHNPFAVNDAVFAKEFGFDWARMNRTGCSLVWGHPQGPTLTRLLIEGVEEAVDLGGGLVLLFGCAAGDVGIAALLEVSDGGRAP